MSEHALQVRPLRRPLIERLLDKCIPEPNSGCWLWLGGILKDRDGKDSYGVIGIGHQYEGTTLAHRASWICHNGPIPDGLVVRHKCDNKLCVNPEHLQLGTYADNNADMKIRGRASRGQKHYGAKLTPEAVISIRADRRTHREISEQYKISGSVVSEIKAGKAWTSVP